jgi:photosystem II stability/assembly factor-like uncharacterized protein
MRLPRLVFLASVLCASSAQAQYYDADMLDRLRFRFIGPATMSGRITDLAVYEADPAVMYVASATGGVWKTTDHAITMRPVFDREKVHSVGAVAVFQGDPNVVWVGTGEATNRQSSGWGDGVYKSDDGGATWRNVGLAEGRHVARIVTHPRDRDIAYVALPGNLWAASAERGLYKTVDGGRTWRLMLKGNDDTGVTEVAMDPSDPETLYAATYQRRRQAYGYVGGGPGSALWKSTDGGATWKRLVTGLPTGDWGRVGISVYRKNPNVVFVSVEQGRRYTSSISYEQRLGGVFRSSDKGETWRFMGDWNPRPSYSSKLLVDPSDESRLYQVQYSVSNDTGKTWREPRQTLHGDDRIIWVDPRDSRHVVKGDDGGLGISWDRGVTWLYQRNLPVSQFYHVGVDNSVPFRVCGGLQDNNSWCGPSATTWTDGILNEDWFRVGGGDGFHTQFDTVDNRTLYVTSQYLGLTRVDLQTMETRTIRPMWPDGDVYKRGNWGPPAPRVGRFQEGANWNAPLTISAFDRRTIYAGMRNLYRSRDRGESWQRLGDFTTGVNRRTLPIMGQLPDSATLSLDDGISFFPSVSAFSESPRDRKVLWVGTDDGQLQVSRDEGATWRNVAAQVPDMPRGTWVRHIEASRWATGTAWVLFDGHQNGDFRNWLYVTTDYGQSWREIAADLPRDIVPHVLREDPVDSKLLYLGTEFGLYLSFNGAQSWVRARGNMPNVPVNDLVVHSRDHALVLGTHGRGIWILDDVRSLRNGRPGARVQLVAGPTVVRQQRRVPKLGHTGDMHFRGENPVNGLPITLWAADSGTSVTVTVRPVPGGDLWKQTVTTNRGLTTLLWNLRSQPLPAAAAAGGDDDERPRGGPSAFVRPGQYTVVLESNGQVIGQRNVSVLPDARQDATPATREAWHMALDSVESVACRAAALAARLRASGPRDKADTAAEVQSRATALFSMLEAQVGTPTADMRAQLASFSAVLARMERDP